MELLASKNGYFYIISAAFFFLNVQGCSFYQGKDEGYRDPVKTSSIEGVIPKAEPRSRYGNPSSYVVFGKKYHVLKDSKGYRKRGLASWYGKKFHGRRTSSGETYDMHQLTAAHKTLPLPTYVNVRNLENGREMILRVNDRGPFHKGRIIDLSYAAAVKLGVYSKGVSEVEVEAIDVQDYVSSGLALRETSSSRRNVRSGHKSAVRNVGGGAGPRIRAADTTLPSSSAARAAGAAGKEFFIQVGAYQQQENAKKVVRELSKLKVDNVEINQKQTLGSIFYRIWIGPFTNRSDISNAVDRISKIGIRSYSVIERPL